MTTSNCHGFRLLVLACFAFGASALAACGGGEPTASNPAGAPPSGTASDASGRWQSDCLGPQNGSYARLTFDNSATEWTLDYDVFGNAACTTALGTVHVEGPYRVDGASTVVPGAHEGTFSFAKRTVTPRAQAFADFLRSAKGCGGGDFTIGTATDILDKGCVGLGAYPRATCSSDSDVFLRDGNVLRFGERPADNNMCTKERRPTALSKTELRAQESKL